ncbi:uncharacterized protein MELLADRAFT_93062 [Melampsora larici-populina 98AG31]|uniref:Uncharacterized protein n=1 Tax=Melampsora larici-populina (strain 98AG31 / pathotype 3-4-7) TaxID=747676 RepID=F4S3T0_MELLP|nr:uncharacterized protein MELLADRAFT_93062 [Melampsora larici-populina 98AG31]EGG00726.1 hypothetical protein MELLADRAFT_93062 [Melampsora larici-populina 98AG31]
MSSLDSHDSLALGSDNAPEAIPTSSFEDMKITTNSADSDSSGSNETSEVSNPPAGRYKVYYRQGPRDSLLVNSPKSDTLCNIPENYEVKFPKSSSSILSTQSIPKTRKRKKLPAGRGTPTQISCDVTGTLSQSLTGYDPVDSPLNRLAIERAILFVGQMISLSDEDSLIPSIKIRMQEDIARILEVPQQVFNHHDLLRSIIDVFRYWVQEMIKRDRSVEVESLLNLIQAYKSEYELS